jgi:PAS domain S-box-containing protein
MDRPPSPAEIQADSSQKPVVLIFLTPSISFHLSRKFWLKLEIVRDTELKIHSPVPSVPFARNVLPSPFGPPPPGNAGTAPFWEAILRNSDDFVWVTGAEGRVEYVNRPLPGMDTAEALGSHPEDCFESPFRERIRAAIDRVRETGEPQRLEAAFGGPVGAERVFAAKVAPIGDGVPPTRLLFTFQDVTHQKQLESELRLASLGAVVSGLAHEINSPNSAIFSNGQALRNIWRRLWPLLEECAPEPSDIRVGSFPLFELRDQIQRALENILESSKRITGMVADLKEFGRPGSYRRDQLVDLSEVAEWACRLLEFKAKKGPFGLERSIEAAPPVLGNAKRLEQVTVNLLQNAFIAMEGRPGTVRIETGPGEAPGTVEIRVLDEGDGIPEADRARVVEPYFTTRRAEGGTGLGLTVSNQIVRDHGGRLIFEDRTGPGARVRVVLPAGPVRAEGEEASSP